MTFAISPSIPICEQGELKEFDGARPVTKRLKLLYKTLARK
jgi:hypothetical protein